LRTGRQIDDLEILHFAPGRGLAGTTFKHRHILISNQWWQAHVQSSSVPKQ
jgi:hypothetical protein